MLIRNRAPRLRKVLPPVLRAVLAIARALFSYRVFVVVFLLLFLTDNLLYRALGSDYEFDSPLLLKLHSAVIIYFFITAGRFLLPKILKIKSLLALLFLFCVALVLFHSGPQPAGKIFYKKMFWLFLEIIGWVLTMGVAFQALRRLSGIYTSHPFFQPVRRVLTFLNILLLVMVVALGAAGYEIFRLETKLAKIETRLGGAAKIGCNEKETITRVRQSVVRIIGGESEGSGFAVVGNGLILTNFHVIEFEPSPKIVMPDNTFRTGEIVMADKNADLAVIKVDRAPTPLVWGNPDELAPAEEILAIGFPLGGELAGEASVSKGSLSGIRRSRDVGVDYLQVDLTLNSGISGGPMVNICGEVVGINTAGLSGLGMGISANSIRQKWLEMSTNKDALQDIQRIEFNPEKSPLEAVRAFYNYLKARKLEKAFELLSDNFKAGFDFDHWKQGYEPLLDTTVIKIEDDPQVADRVQVKLATKDFIDGEIVYQYFEGYWDVRPVEGKLRLWQAAIKRVEEPGFMWYYE